MIASPSPAAGSLAEEQPRREPRRRTRLIWSLDMWATIESRLGSFKNIWAQ
jgi:hypothetical protein